MKKFILYSLFFVLSACSFQTTHRGYVFPADLESEVSGIKTAAALEQKFGSPMAKTIYGDTVWIYYGADENLHGPFPTSYDNRTALLARVKGSRVTEIKIMRDGDLPDINIADGETEIPAAIELNAIQELFNNIGRFSPAGLGQ